MFSISTETNVLLASSTGLTGYCPKWILLLCGSLKTYADDHLQLWLTDFGACKISHFGDKGNELWHQRELSGFTSSVRIRQKVYSTDKQRGSNWKNQQIESEARAFDECLSDKWLSLSESEQSEAVLQIFKWCGYKNADTEFQSVRPSSPSSSTDYLLGEMKKVFLASECLSRDSNISAEWEEAVKCTAIAVNAEIQPIPDLIIDTGVYCCGFCDLRVFLNHIFPERGVQPISA